MNNMGMFDYVKVEMLLGGKDLSHIPFQTKDTPLQFLANYVVSEDGRLLEPVTEPDAMTDEEKIERYHKQGYKDNISLEEYLKDPITRLMGSLRTKTISMRDTKFHGDLDIGWSNICSSCRYGYRTEDGKRATYYNFILRFTNGVVESISGGITGEKDKDYKQLTQDEIDRLMRIDRKYMDIDDKLVVDRIKWKFRDGVCLNIINDDTISAGKKIEEIEQYLFKQIG